MTLSHIECRNLLRAREARRWYVIGAHDHHSFSIELDPKSQRFLSLTISPACPHAVENLPGWVTPELLADTIRTWSLHYHRLVPVAEAIAILERVRRLALTLRSSLQGESA